MKAIKKFLIVLTVLFAGILAIAAIYRMTGKKKTKEEETRPLVTTVSPELRDIYVYTEQIGTVEPEESLTLMPRTAGEIIELKVKEGDFVEEGQEICHIKSDALNSLRIQADSARVQMNDAASALQRTQELFDAGAVSRQMLDQASSAAKSTKLAYDAAQEQYNLQSGYGILKAPIAGVVDSLNIGMHDMVSPQTPALIISVKEKSILRFGISESVRNTLQQGDGVRFEYKGEMYDALVSEIDEKISPASGLFTAKALITDAHEIPMGSKVKMTLVKAKAESVLSIPLSAVYYSNNRPFVYLLEQDRAVKREFEAGIYDEAYMEVLSGLGAQDVLIGSWSSELYDGASVLKKGEEEGADTKQEPEKIQESGAGE